MYLFYFLYVYIVIVLIGAVSHGFLSLYLSTNDLKVNKHKKLWEKILVRCEKKNNYKFKRREIYQLKNPQKLAAFYEVYSNASKDVFIKIIENNKWQMIAVARRYKSTTMKAYFAYIFSVFCIEDEEVSTGLDNLMIEFLDENSVYVRENVLKVLYSFGNAGKVKEAYEVLSKKKVYHSQKLLTDGLMKFSGDVEELMTLLMNNLDVFMECYQISIINVLAYKEIHIYDNQLIKYMMQKDVSIDVKCAVLRVLGKVRNEENKSILISSLLQYKHDEGWEEAAVAANMLGIYEEDEEVAKLLSQSITSRNWYIRMNSAYSLIKIGMSSEYKNEILDGDDAYAKDALTYAMSLGKGGRNDG